MIINEVAKGDASLLIDEQGTSDGFPVHFPKTRWSIQVPVGEPSWYLPANAVIDLRRDYVITHICIFHGDGQPGTYKINYGIPFQWSALIADSVIATNKWIEHKFAEITTRFLQISKQEDSKERIKFTPLEFRKVQYDTLAGVTLGRKCYVDNAVLFLFIPD